VNLRTTNDINAQDTGKKSACLYRLRCLTIVSKGANMNAAKLTS